MKRVVSVLLGAVLFCTGCTSGKTSSDHARTSSVDEFTQKYVLTAFYGTDADREAFIKERKEEGILHNITFDEKSGYLTITASLTQAQYWVQEAETQIENNSLTIDKDDNYSISVNSSDTQMTVTGSEQSDLNDLKKTVDSDLMAMEIHQVFSGISSWHIDVDLVSQDTGEKVKSFSLPDEEFSIDKSIWK